MGRMAQRISPLGEADQQQLEAQREAIHAYVAPESREALERPAGKLGLIRALLDARTFRPDQTWELQSLGIVFGDALVQHIPEAEWVMVEDELGRDPAVRIAGMTVVMFPLTMISKRVEEEKRSMSSTSSTGCSTNSRHSRLESSARRSVPVAEFVSASRGQRQPCCRRAARHSISARCSAAISLNSAARSRLTYSRHRHRGPHGRRRARAARCRGTGQSREDLPVLAGRRARTRRSSTTAVVGKLVGQHLV